MCLVSGPSGSGKTTLVERLIPALARRGVSAGTVKHHRGRIRVDQEGKDTWRHRRAGARATFFVTQDEVAAFFDRPPGPPDLDGLARLCPPEVRLLLVEGFKGLEGYPRIEVVRRGVEREGSWPPDVLCAATDVEGLEVPFPVFGLDDVEGIADLLLRQVLSHPS